MKSVLESLTGSIADFIVAIFSFIFLLIDSVVYAIIGWAYDMFTIIAGARVLDESALRDLADRIYIVIGVIALFIVAYALLQAIIDPDKASKGDTSLGKIIPNIAIAIVGIAIVPTIFNYAYDVQRMILCNNIIPKLLLDNSISYDDNGYYKSEKSGAEIATLLFESFFYPKNNDGGYANVSSEEGYIQMLHDTHGDFTGGDLGQAYEDAKKGGWFWTTFSPFIDDIAKGNVGYLIIISTIAGGYCAYVLITYCFDAAIRAVKLAYLEILAPLPLLLMIVPGQKKIFQNWLKKTLSCFFEIFIRIFAIVFVAFIMRHLPDLIFNMSSMFNNGYGCLTNPGFITMLLIRALLINALFAFMKDAPKLVSDITGIDSKGFGIGLKGKGVLGDLLGNFNSAAIGGATGALGGLATGLGNKDKINWKKAVAQGATQGFKSKGVQFSKQRQATFQSIGEYADKDQGFLGGESRVSKFINSHKDDVKKDYGEKANEKIHNGLSSERFDAIKRTFNRDGVSNRINAFENSDAFRDATNYALQRMEAAGETSETAKKAEIESYLANLKENTTDGNLKRLISQYYNDKKVLEKSNALDRSRQKLTAATDEHNRSQAELSKVRRMISDNNDKITQINSAMSSKKLELDAENSKLNMKRQVLDDLTIQVEKDYSKIKEVVTKFTELHSDLKEKFENVENYEDLKKSLTDYVNELKIEDQKNGGYIVISGRDDLEKAIKQLEECDKIIVQKEEAQIDYDEVLKHQKEIQEEYNSFVDVVEDLKKEARSLSAQETKVRDELDRNYRIKKEAEVSFEAAENEFVKEVNIAAESVYNGDSSIIRNGHDILKALNEDLERAKANGNQALEQIISDQIKIMEDYRGSKKGLDTMNKKPDYEKELLDYFKKQKKDN